LDGKDGDLTDLLAAAYVRAAQAVDSGSAAAALARWLDVAHAVAAAG
jgi:anthranilate phosphoribosyltransferase